MEDLMFGPSKRVSSPMDDASESGRWFCKEDWTSRAATGRSIFHSRVWASDGTQIATLMQDGMIRITKKPEPTSEELARLQDRRAKWKARGKL